MARNLLGAQRDGFDAGGFADLIGNACLRSHVERKTATEVWQREGALSVAAIGRADQIEERVVLRNRKERSVTELPAGGIEASAEQTNFTDVWLNHLRSPPWPGRNPQTERRCAIWGAAGGPGGGAGGRGGGGAGRRGPGAGRRGGAK